MSHIRSWRLVICPTATCYIYHLESFNNFDFQIIVIMNDSTYRHVIFFMHRQVHEMQSVHTVLMYEINYLEYVLGSKSRIG